MTFAFWIAILPSGFVGSMISRPAHIQDQLGRGIESHSFRGEKMGDGMTDAGWFAIEFPSALQRMEPPAIAPTPRRHR